MSKPIDITALSYLRKIEYLKQKEVCLLFGVCRATLWHWEKKLKLPVIRKKGMHPLYDKAEIVKWLKDKPNLHHINLRVEKLSL